MVKHKTNYVKQLHTSLIRAFIEKKVFMCLHKHRENIVEEEKHFLLNENTPVRSLHQNLTKRKTILTLRMSGTKGER